MSKHKVEITGIKTSELKVLTNDEQMELFNKMKNGDKFWISRGKIKYFKQLIQKYWGE